jgi:type III secretion protein L
MLQLNISEKFELRPESKRIPAAAYQAYLNAEQTLAAAGAEANRIIARAQEEYEAQKKRGYEDGLEEGRLEAAAKMMDSVGRSIDYFSALESKMVSLVVKALKRILGEMDDTQRVVGVVRSALSVARNEANVTLRVAPAEAEIAKQKLDEITRPYPGIHFLEVVPDSRLASTDCILETQLGVVDAGLETQLAAIEKSLQRSFGSS